MPGGRAPAEEAVACGLHQPLSLDHPAPVIAESAGAGVGLQHRIARLLGLQEQRVAVVATGHQEDPGTGADAAHPDHLVGHVAESVLGEKTAAVALQRLRVALEHLVDPILGLPPARRVWQQLLHRHDQRRAADDSQLAVHPLGEAAQRAHAVLGVRLGDALLRSLHRLAAQLLHPGHHRRDVEARVPDLQVAHRGESPHRLPVLARRGHHRRAPLLALEAIPPGRDLEAGGEPLHVPLPGRRAASRRSR